MSSLPPKPDQNNREAEYYVQVPLALITSKRLSLGAKVLYARLVWYVGENPTAWPSHKTLAIEINAGVRSITEWLIELRDDGWITWEERPGTSSIYKLTGQHLMRTPSDTSAANADPLRISRVLGPQTVRIGPHNTQTKINNKTNIENSVVMVVAAELVAELSERHPKPTIWDEAVAAAAKVLADDPQRIADDARAQHQRDLPKWVGKDSRFVPGLPRWFEKYFVPSSRKPPISAPADEPLRCPSCGGPVIYFEMPGGGLQPDCPRCAAKAGEKTA